MGVSKLLQLMNCYQRDMPIKIVVVRSGIAIWDPRLMREREREGEGEGAKKTVG